MRINLFLHLLLVSWCVSCTTADEKEAEESSDGDSLNTHDKRHIDGQVAFMIDNVQVLTARKVGDPHSNYFKEYKALCKDWKPSKAVITEIFGNSKIIDSHEYHYYYEILPCYVIGRLVVNCDITAKYELNAGGSAILLLPDTAYFVGYYGNKHFLSYRAEY